MKQKSSINSIAKYMRGSVEYHLRKQRNTKYARSTRSTVKRYSALEYLRRRGYVESGMIQRPDCGESCEGVQPDVASDEGGTERGASDCKSGWIRSGGSQGQEDRQVV